MTYYSRSENSRGEKELLSEHLKKTAKLAGEFAGVFGEGKAAVRTFSWARVKS